MTLGCFALLFQMKERCKAGTKASLLNARDVVGLLAIYPPRRRRNEAEVLRQMQRRLAARQRDLNNRRRRLKINESKLSKN